MVHEPMQVVKHVQMFNKTLTLQLQISKTPRPPFILGLNGAYVEVISFFLCIIRIFNIDLICKITSYTHV